MRYTQSDEALAFHRDPSYWDGYVLGETGPDMAQNTIDNFLPGTARAAANNIIALKALKARLTDMHTYWPDETLGPEQVFDPADYEPLTVIALTRESICVNSKAERPLKHHIYPPTAGVSTPPRVYPNLQHKKSAIHHIKTPSFEYLLDSHWAIITKGSHGNQITDIPNYFVSYQGRARVAPCFSSLSSPDIIPVGRTLGRLQYINPRRPEPLQPSPNFFLRYNHIDVLNFGAPPNRRKLLGNILSKLAIGELPKTAPGV